VGLQAAGTLRSSALDFKYGVSLVNGRGRIPDEVTNVQDRNWTTSPPIPTSPGGKAEIHERILGARSASASIR
jgi:hypothetical protein